MENDVVVTVGHKMKDFVGNPGRLSVRLGDWDPNVEVQNVENTAEEIPHIKVQVVCVKIHPDAKLRSTLDNNIAVLKLGSVVVDVTDSRRMLIADVVRFRKGPKRPANNPKGVKGFSIVNGTSALDAVLGLVSDVPNEILGLRQITEVPKSYINTVCLPESEEQFQNYADNCWVAAWGDKLERQREVDIPLVSKPECERRLRPVFKEKGHENWTLKPSEMCAGGEPDKDTCKGEGGAPLVCYDRVTIRIIKI